MPTTLSVLTLLVLLCPKWSLAQFGFGGSERLKEIEESLDQFKEIVEDKQHMQDEVSEFMNKVEVRRMNQDELAFNFYYVHDTDEDGKLDGLELFKAILHGQLDHRNDKGGYADETTPEFDHSEAMAKATELVDTLLQAYDQNEDGLLDYVEFKMSFADNSDKLKGKL